MSKFTPSQQTAIDSNANEILVSAAAGSGKTSVLTERILRHLRNNIDITNLLVVTFTEAASAEMKERITKEIKNDPKLSGQLSLLPIADISTIHSFCRKLVKDNFQIVDIDPSFRVGDEAEVNLIKSIVMDELFEDEYNRDDNEDFIDLVNVYGGKTMDGRLDLLVRKIFDFMDSDPFPEDAAKRYVSFFKENVDDLDETKWVYAARDELKVGLNGAVEGLLKAIKICSKPGGPIKYLDRLNEDLNMIYGLLETINEPFDEMYKIFKQVAFGTLTRITKKDLVDDELKESVKRIREDAVKKRVKDLIKGIFFAPPEKMKADLSALAPRVKAIVNLTNKFSERFAFEKRVRNILDFSDLEHFAIQILYPNGKGNPSNPDFKHYHEVLVDEYQDSNEIQDLILSALSNKRFMVGDVKQSIYRFRRADPKIFRDKYENFAKSSEDENNLRIDLSSNFRSRPEVINAVNFFFSQLMSRDGLEIEYDSEAALHAGRENYPSLKEEAKMHVELLDLTDDEDNEEESLTKVIAETRLIAKIIHELVGKKEVFDKALGKLRPCGYSDIVVLSRGINAVAVSIIDELKKQGIDAAAEKSASFFDRKEIKTALAFLKITDNPRQDIELIMVLKSPVYDFSPDELFLISAEEEKDFYSRLVSYAKSNKNELSQKIEEFFIDLETWRKASINLSISRLIGFIFDSTNYPAYVSNMDMGVVRQANLRLLLEKAIEFEDKGLKNLFHFIRYIDKLSESGNISGASESTSLNCNKVRLMTIHKSKGLEFPIVICAFLAKQFNRDEERQPVVLHPEMGLGSYYVNFDKRTRSNTLARYSLGRRIRRESLAEELRCLYVALTRAEEMIILTGSMANLQKQMEKWQDFKNHNETNLPLYCRLSAKNYLDWIMPCVLRENFDGSAGFEVNVNNLSDLNNNPCAGEEIFNETTDDYAVVLEPFKKNLDEILPSKLSISEIIRLYDITPDSTINTEENWTFDLPEFLKAERGITSLKAGSNIHTVVQFIDYNKHTTKEGLEDLFNELVSKNLLEETDTHALNKDVILKYMKSNLAGRIRQSKNVCRETPFVSTINPSDLYPSYQNGSKKVCFANFSQPVVNTETEGFGRKMRSSFLAHEKILVHGIIDCYFEEDNEIVLVDYKSDFIPNDLPINEWAEKHKTQMMIYKNALMKSTKKNVKEVLLYSFSRGKVVQIV